jgi:predicted nucleic acid-binding protein
MTIWLPGVGFAERLTRLAIDLGVSGVRMFDLQIALTAAENGAHEIWTHDAAFVRVPSLRIRDPL